MTDRSEGLGAAQGRAPGVSRGGRGSVLKYLTGLGFAIVLTLASFWAAGTDLVWHPAVPVDMTTGAALEDRPRRHTFSYAVVPWLWPPPPVANVPSGPAGAGSGAGLPGTCLPGSPFTDSVE